MFKNWRSTALLALLALTVTVASACGSTGASSTTNSAPVEKTQAEIDAQKKVDDANAKLEQAQKDLEAQNAELEQKKQEEAKAAEEKTAADAEAKKQADEAAAAKAESEKQAAEAKALEEAVAKAKADNDAAKSKELADQLKKAQAEAAAAKAEAKKQADEQAAAKALAAKASAAALAANKARFAEAQQQMAAHQAALELQKQREAEQAKLEEQQRIAAELAKAEAERKAAFTGTIKIDGSSTVFPISEAVSSKFNKEYLKVRVPVAVSGTGGGFTKFCKGETDINDASRTIKATETDACTKGGIESIPFEVAYDGITVSVNQNNDFAKTMTVAELKKIFEPNSKVVTWADVRAGWPAETIKIYSPGTASGTFDYFTEHVNGKAGASRNDSQVTFSENDNVLVQGISGSKYAIGYFGYSYYEENMSKLNAVSVEGIQPTYETIQNKSYPISRMLYIYVNKKAFARPEVKEYVTYYVKNVGSLVKAVGYIKLPQSFYDADLAKIPQ